MNLFETHKYKINHLDWTDTYALWRMWVKPDLQWLRDKKIKHNFLVRFKLVSIDHVFESLESCKNIEWNIFDYHCTNELKLHKGQDKIKAYFDSINTDRRMVGLVTFYVDIPDDVDAMMFRMAF